LVDVLSWALTVILVEIFDKSVFDVSMGKCNVSDEFGYLVVDKCLDLF